MDSTWVIQEYIIINWAKIKEKKVSAKLEPI